MIAVTYHEHPAAIKTFGFEIRGRRLLKRSPHCIQCMGSRLIAYFGQSATLEAPIRGGLVIYEADFTNLFGFTSY